MAMIIRVAVFEQNYCYWWESVVKITITYITDDILWAVFILYIFTIKPWASCLVSRKTQHLKAIMNRSVLIKYVFINYSTWRDSKDFVTPCVAVICSLLCVKQYSLTFRTLFQQNVRAWTNSYVCACKWANRNWAPKMCISFLCGSFQFYNSSRFHKIQQNSLLFTSILVK